MDNTRQCVFWALGALVLYAAWSLDPFQISRYDDWIGFDSSLVITRLALFAEGAVSWFHPLTTVYFSQFGLQGMFLALVHKVLGGSVLFFALYAAQAVCALTAMVVSAIYVKLARFTHGAVFFTAIFLSSFSPQLLNFSKSLYWVPFTLVLPSLVVAWGYTGTFGYHTTRKLFVLLFLSVLLKALCGYEYITCVILAPLVVMLFLDVSTENPLDKRRYAAMALCGILAFGLALALHVAQLSLVTGGNGLAIISERAGARTLAGAGSDLQHYRQEVLAEVRRDKEQEGLWYRLMAREDRLAYVALGAKSFFTYFIRPVVALSRTPDSFSSLPVWFFVALLGVSLPLARKNPTPQLRAFAWAQGMGLLCSLQWQVLAFNHMAIHLHLNQIVFFLPFLLFAYLFVGLLVAKAILMAQHHVWSRARLLVPQSDTLRPGLALLIFFAVLVTLNVARIRLEYALPHVASRLQISRLSTANPPPELIFAFDRVEFGIPWKSRELQKSGILWPKVLTVDGWAFDSTRPATSVSLVLEYKGAVLATTQTDVDRPDVARVHPRAGGSAGFHLEALVDEREVVLQDITVAIVSGNKVARIKPKPASP